MSDDASPLNWTPQQWAMLRSAIQESARRSRVASKFLPLDGPVPKDQATVPAYTLDLFGQKPGLGEGNGHRLQLRPLGTR